MERLISLYTVEEVLDFKMADIKHYRIFNGQKVSGYKLKLASRACNFIKLTQSISDSDTATCGPSSENHASYKM